MNVLEKLGIKQEKKADFVSILFHFMREFHINPLDEEYQVGDKIIKKRGMSIPLFVNLLKEAEKFHEMEKREYERARRR